MKLPMRQAHILSSFLLLMLCEGAAHVGAQQIPTASINNVSIVEGNSGTKILTFTVTLSLSSNSPELINFATTNGTATAGSDYVSASGTLVFEGGTTTQNINITINGDTFVEPDETFFVDILQNGVQLPGQPRSVIIGKSRGVGTIINDDFAACSTVVTNTADSGAGSLRQAITCANSTLGTDTISFAIPGAGIHSIVPTSPLPMITDPVIIDGYTQPGASANTNGPGLGDNAVPLIEINGANAGVGASGLHILAGGSTVRGLIINRFVKKPDNASPTGFDDGHGIVLETGNGNVVKGNFIGTDASGAAASANQQSGVFVLNSSNNIIGGTAPADRNLISGNSLRGVDISTGANGNKVVGNFIGAAKSGKSALGNAEVGVLVSGSSSNTIGGLTAASRNVISGNTKLGVSIQQGAKNNIVEGNFVGTDVSGALALSNLSDGVVVVGAGTSANTVGGAARNVIAANGGSGVNIFGGASANTIAGNFIGTDLTGTKALGNGGDGVAVFDSASNIVGGAATTPGTASGNLISGNARNGIRLQNASTTQVQGNLIGTNAAGTATLGNAGHGIRITSGAKNNTIGGAANLRNVISGQNNSNAATNFFPAGVSLEEAGTTGNTVASNFIGTDISGTKALGNSVGVSAIKGASGNTIGGTSAAARNVISGNVGLDGVSFVDAGTTINTVEGNFIGTDLTGTKALGNARSGVGIFSGAANNTVGGTSAAARNVIAGNTLDGVSINNPGTTGNTVAGNFLGLDITGAKALGNTRNGVAIFNGATNNTVGGLIAGARNVIGGNTGDGVSLSDAGTTGNVVEGNFIGLDITGAKALGNTRNGVAIFNGATNNTVGGTSAAARNVIAGNDKTTPAFFPAGVKIGNAGTTGNKVQGNFIGTDVTGTKALGNQLGVGIVSGATNNTFGGLTATPGTAPGNLISGNKGDGLNLTDSNSNFVQGNLVGTDVTGAKALPNDGGVSIFGASSNNTIGGATTTARNVLSASATDGVFLAGNAVTNNKVQGNFIGTDITGTKALSNLFQGIEADNGSHGNLIGGSTATPGAAPGNLISGNVTGVVIGAVGTSFGNTVQGNLIGTDITGTKALPNANSGVSINAGAHNNLIGGTTANLRNVIAFNGGNGVKIAGSTDATPNPIANTVEGNSIFSNARLGIELNAVVGGVPETSGTVTPNDTGDGDSGPNNLQNFPVISTVDITGNNVRVRGTLNSTANTTFRLEFFTNVDVDPSGFGEGQTFLGTTNVTTAANGNAPFDVTFASTAPSRNVTATATDPAGNTSEFAGARVKLLLTPATAFNVIGASHTLTATLTVNELLRASTTVNFRVTAGPDIGKTGSGITTAQGTATFTYADTGGAGTDTIQATGAFGIIPFTATSTKTWTPPADLRVTQVANPPSVGVGQTTTFNITVTNAPLGEGASITARSATLTDNLPPGATFISANPAPNINRGSVLTFNLGDLAVGASRSIAVTLRLNQAGTALNHVVASSLTGDPVLSNNTADASASATSGPTDVTPQITITQSAFTPLSGYLPGLLTARRVAQVVTLHNNGAPLSSPISLVLSNISASAHLNNATGSTAAITPAGRPFITVPVGSDNVFSTGETVTVRLEFSTTSIAKITYTPVIIAGPGAR